MLFLLKKYALIYLLSIFWLAALSNANGADFVNVAAPHESGVQSAPAAQKCANLGNSGNLTNNTNKKLNYTLEILLPLMDMELQQEHNVHVMNEKDHGIILVLHGAELFQLHVSRQTKRLDWLGTLEGGMRNTEVLGVTLIYWHDYLLLTVALEETVEIYQISIANLAKRVAAIGTAGTALHFERIQQLMLPGKLRELNLLRPAENRVMLIIATNFSKLHGKYKTYEWLETYFNPIEEITLPAINTLTVIGTYPKYIITGRNLKAQTKSIQTVYEVLLPSLKLQRKQTLNMDARLVHAVTFRKRNYLVSCAGGVAKPCLLFRMSHEGQFVVYKQRTSRELYFDKFAAGRHMLVATRQQEVRIFSSARLDCYSSYTANETDVSDLFAHTNAMNETFVLLSYKRPFNTLIRMVELEMGSGELLAATAFNYTEQEEMNSLQRHRHEFEETVGRLRSLFLERKFAMDTFRRASRFMSSQAVRMNDTLTVHGGKIDSIHLMNANLRTPTQLWAQVERLRVTLTTHHRRPTRSFGVGNKTSDAKQKIIVKHLQVKNLIYDGDLIEGFHLDASAKPVPILSIRRPLSTKVLNTTSLLQRQNYKRKRVARSNIKKLHALNVQRINNVSWTEFYDSLFLRGRDNKIEGRLILQANAEIDNLETPLLNDLVVNQLFNVKEPQVVRSNLNMSSFFVTELNAERINGLDFANDIVLSGTNATIATPVKIDRMTVAGDIFFDNTQKFSNKQQNSLNDNDTQPTLQQYYNGKVTIEGSLSVQNLLRESNTTRMYIQNISIAAEDLADRYLLKNTPQNFTKLVKFGNAKISVPKLITQKFNNHPVDEYLLSNGQGNYKQPIFVIFMNAQITGNVICKNHVSKLKNIAENIVRRDEPLVNITGYKKFMHSLTVAELVTNKLNNINVKDLVLKSQLQQQLNLNKTITAEKLIVNGDMYVAEAFHARFLNNFPLDELLNNDYKIERLELSYPLNVKNIIFDNINGQSFDEAFSKLYLSNDKLVLRKELEIVGNVEFAKNLIVKTINGINWNNYTADLVYAGEDALITGKKYFQHDVNIMDALETTTINEKDWREHFEKTLLNSTQQIITGDYTFADLEATNLDVLSINEVPTTALIDTSLPNVVIESDLIVPKLIINGSLYGEFESPVNFSDIPNRLKALQMKQWRNIVVHGDLHWNTSNVAELPTQYEQLKYLIKNAVTRSGNHIITGNVRLVSPTINNMYTKSKLQQFVDLGEIAKDALMWNTNTPQIVVAPKTFYAPVRVQNVYANVGMEVDLFNGIDVKRLNASLYYLDSGAPIAAKLYFQTPPIIEHLINKDGSVNGISSEQIYQLNELPIPALTVRKLVVEHNLTLGDVNGMSLDYLLENRVPLYGEPLEIFGELTFENLILAKKALVRSINGINLDNLVYEYSDTLQAITAPKTILGDLYLPGPVHVRYLNEHDLSELYTHTIFTNKDYNIDSLIIDEATFEAGLVQGGDNMIGAMQEPDVKSLIEDFNEILTAQRRHKNLIHLNISTEMDLMWRVAPQNVSIDATYLLDDVAHAPPTTYCARQQYQLQISMEAQRVYAQNLTFRQFTWQRGELAVKVENICKNPTSNVRSKIMLGCRHVTHTLGMRKFIKNIEIFSATNTNVASSFVLLHAIDIINPARNELRILKVNHENCSLLDWQSLKHGIGSHTKLFPLCNNAALLITNGSIEQQPMLSIYAYHAESEEFVQMQQIPIDFEFSELVTLPHKIPEYQLLLSKRNSTRITVLTLNAAMSDNFEIQQTVELSTPIERLHYFALQGRHYVLALSTGNIYLLKYAYIEGWVQLSLGHFEDVQMAVPLMPTPTGGALNDNNLLLLLCKSRQCNFVSVN